MSLYTRIADLQKLHIAWNKVKKNKPSAGADHITFEQFDADAKAQLTQLHLELIEHRYEVFPVKLVTIKHENKVREVSLFSMRDKVVQASLAQELSNLLDEKFAPCACAYRKNSSALHTVGEIEETIKSGQFFYFLKTDVKGFFDHIVLEKLEANLHREIPEDDVVELIMTCLKAPAVTEDGELEEKRRGVYQGSGISPVLSNLYLNEFDHAILEEDAFYIRYADDILVLCKSQEVLQHIRTKMTGLLQDLGLELNVEKTYSRLLEGGFDFLGYHFDNTGKSVPVKAQEKMETSLEDVWLTLTGIGIEGRLKKCSQILNGWKQYYKGDDTVDNIYVFTTLIYMMRDYPEAETFAEHRKEFVNNYRDIAIFLSSVWDEMNRADLMLLEYEQLFDVAVDPLTECEKTLREELLAFYQELIKGENEQAWLSVMQAYSDMGLYDRAQKVLERVDRLRQHYPLVANLSSEVTDKEATELKFDSKTIQMIMELLIGREDMFTREILAEDGKRVIQFVPEPLTTDVIRKHLLGKETIGTYLIRGNDTVHFLVIDVDISRKAILNAGNDPNCLQDNLTKAAEYALLIQKALHDMGIKSYVEFSGYRGYHVWIFFSEWIPIRYVYSFLEIIHQKIPNAPEPLTTEFFPAKNRKKSGKSGQNVKLPYGIHVVSGKRSFFCDSEMKPVLDPEEVLSAAARYTTVNLKKVIGSNISNIPENGGGKKKCIELDFVALKTKDESVLRVLKGCSLMQYLVHKSMTTGYLSHFERLSVLHVFGHLGEEGKEFVHEVMSHTINYQHYVTQRFIVKLPGKPVSCVKLRDQYKQITAEYGCDCIFKRTKNCYPSPVLHALQNSSEDTRNITIPLSRTLTKAKAEKVYEELNAVNRMQELAGKLLELKKQKRGIDKAIGKVEKELNVIFDANLQDCVEIEMGVLSRRKTETGYEWTIEI